MGTDPDQLPLMQHALMRLWELARARAPNAPHLHLDDYDAEGGIKGSLSRHADEIFAEITRDVAERADTARRLFCLLTEGEGESAVRRLAEVAEVIEVTGKPLDEIAAAADPFRALGRSLLMPALERPLAPDTVLDISHESLIRQWQKLRDWVQVEAASADHYRDNERRAQRWSARTAEFLDGIDLDVALDWRSRERPTAQWAARYGGDFAIAMRFLDESQERRDRLSREAAKERAAAANRLAERLAEAQLHQSRFLTERAREALRDEHLETAKAIAMAALPDDLSAPDRPIWFPAVSVLADARSRDRQRAVLQRLSAAFSPDGARVVTACSDNTARLWDVATGASLAVLQGHTQTLTSAAFSPDGAWVVTACSDNTARLWDVTTGASLAVLQGHTQTVASAAFSPDGARVVTASWDNTARLWDVATGASLAVLQGHTQTVTSAAFSPDGARVVTASWDNTARLWDVATGTSLAVLQGHTQTVASAAFSPDGARVVTASWDNTARLWDVTTGASLAVLQGHTQRVNSAAFSPDRTRVLTASSDTTARLWDRWPLLTVDTVAYAQIAALRDLSKDERASLFLIEADTGPGQEHVTATTDDPGSMCDRLAGDPFDPHKGAPGVPFSNIDAEKAVSACRTAAEAAPGELRLSYQLGRALLRADERDEAAALIRAAAEKSYPAAEDTLGDLYKNAIGVAKDDAQALRLYRQAAEGGYAPAFSDEGRLYWDGIGTGMDRVEAVRWFKRGADHSDPFSHQRLAELYEIGGDQLPQNLERALFHRAIETNLFEAAGYTMEAAIARARRGSLARALPPEIAVRIAREAAAWRPKGS